MWWAGSRPFYSQALEASGFRVKNIFGAFFRNTSATIMRCGRTFRLARTHPAHARLSGSGTLSRTHSLLGYTIDTHESEFSEATPIPSRYHVDGNRGLRDRDAELEQFTVNLGRAPQRVLKTHSSDQVAHLTGDPRPAPGERDFHRQ